MSQTRPQWSGLLLRHQTGHIQAMFEHLHTLLRSPGWFGGAEVNISHPGMPDHMASTGGTYWAAQLQPYRAIFQAEMENGISFLVASGYFCHPPDFDRVRDPHPGALWGHGREGTSAESHG